jgi:hypothetical protein
VLGYAHDLKLFMTIKCIGDYQLFQSDLDRTALKSVDLGVIIHEKMSFLTQMIENAGFY